MANSTRSALTLCIAMMLAAAGQASASGIAMAIDGAGVVPETISLTGTVRDFRRFDAAGGHPDFEQFNTGHRTNLVNNELDKDGKPTLRSSTGLKLASAYKDAQGRQINPALFNASLGDVAGVLQNTSGAAVSSESSFSQWFRDVEGVNISFPHTITLTREPGTNKYVFHEHDNNSTAQREGFFPADGKGYNDTDPTYLHNYHFTYELETQFEYDADDEQVFTFYGDDDVWVFVDGKLVIDIGGVHGAVSQTIDMKRLGLDDGKTYSLSFFFAERHLTRSNFRVETNLQLRNVELPTTAGAYD